MIFVDRVITVGATPVVALNAIKLRKPLIKNQ